jgi:hypothetical protein
VMSGRWFGLPVECRCHNLHGLVYFPFIGPEFGL